MRRHAPMVTILLAGFLAGTAFPAMAQDEPAAEEQREDEGSIVVTVIGPVIWPGPGYWRYTVMYEGSAVVTGGACPGVSMMTVPGSVP